MNHPRHPLIIGPTKLLASGAVLAAAAFVSSAPATAAPNTPIACGSIVTSDVRLHVDLLDCEGSALIIGTSGVTIDLAGHTIDGTGSGAGIDNGAGHDDIRLIRGTIREFTFGVHLFETSRGRLDRLVTKDNSIGVIVERSDHVELDRVTAVDNRANGIDVTFSDRIHIRSSTAASNELGGIVDRFSNATTYERNTLIGNSAPGLTVDLSTGVVVERNHVAANDSDGIQLSGVEDARLQRNHAVANHGHGIAVDRPGNTLTRNHAIGNSGAGIAAPDGTVDGGRNRASSNLGGDCTGVDCR